MPLPLDHKKEKMRNFYTTLYNIRMHLEMGNFLKFTHIGREAIAAIHTQAFTKKRMFQTNVAVWNMRPLQASGPDKGLPYTGLSARLGKLTLS